MDNAMRVEVHFHQQDEASVFFESTFTADEGRPFELYFFTCFTVGQLLNLGNDKPGTSTLAEALMKMELPMAPLDDDMMAFIAFIMGTAPGTPKLVDYKGSPGRKMFEAELRFSSSSSFRLEHKGFGFLGTGLGYYVPHSVFLLLKYLARKRIQDADYLYTLAKVAERSGQAYLSGKLDIENQPSRTYDAMLAVELLRAEDR